MSKSINERLIALNILKAETSLNNTTDSSIQLVGSKTIGGLPSTNFAWITRSFLPILCTSIAIASSTLPVTGKSLMQVRTVKFEDKSVSIPNVQLEADGGLVGFTTTETGVLTVQTAKNPGDCIRFRVVRPKKYIIAEPDEGLLVIPSDSGLVWPLKLAERGSSVFLQQDGKKVVVRRVARLVSRHSDLDNDVAGNVHESCINVASNLGLNKDQVEAIINSCAQDESDPTLAVLATYATGDFKGTIERFSGAGNLYNDDKTLVLTCTARAYVELKNYQKAVELLSTDRKSKSESPEVLNTLAYVYRKAGNKEASDRCLSQLCSILRTQRSDDSLLASTLLQLAFKSPTNKRAIYLEILKLPMDRQTETFPVHLARSIASQNLIGYGSGSPQKRDPFEILVNEANVLENSGAISEAKELYIKAAKSLPKGNSRSSFLFWKAAHLEEIQDHNEDAERYLELALESDPQNYPIMLELAQLKAYTKDYLGSEELCSKILRNENKNKRMSEERTSQLKALLRSIEKHYESNKCFDAIERIQKLDALMNR